MPNSEKKIGLAFGGGAVLGASHLGVLRALDEYDIRVDMVAGTSIGAFVAALHAFGRTWEEIKDMVHDLEWLDVYRISLSKYALLTNEKLGALLTESIGSVRLEEAPIPLAVVATDIVNGEKVVITQGSVADAVMASSCIPGVFEPVEVDGRLLVDGGVVENVPLTPLRDMGADFLVGAQLSTTPRERPDNIVQVLVNSFLFALKVATDLQVEEADLILRPDLTEFSMFDTSQVEKLIDVGYEEAKAKLGQLR